MNKTYWSLCFKFCDKMLLPTDSIRASFKNLKHIINFKNLKHSKKYKSKHDWYANNTVLSPRSLSLLLVTTLIMQFFSISSNSDFSRIFKSHISPIAHISITYKMQNTSPSYFASKCCISVYARDLLHSEPI